MTSPEKTTFRYDAEVACYKKQINDTQDPSRNHPIHDQVEKLTYGGGRYVIAVVMDGVSESKSEKKTVPITRLLCWDLARFCHEQNPLAMQEIVDWFKTTTVEPKYGGQGNTTVVLLRLDRVTGVVDGMGVGDSVMLLATDRLVTGEDGEAELRCQAEVLAPLHCVANYPGVIWNGWRHGIEFRPDTFTITLPEGWVNLYLVAMSDGYGKISPAAANRLYDWGDVDRILAERYPDFARVFLPAALAPLLPEVKRRADGRILRRVLQGRDEVWDALRRYYAENATPAEQREMETVDLDCLDLRKLFRSRESPPPLIHGRTPAEVLATGHRTLGWMAGARYMESEDELGLEEYLRQYVMAEQFVQALISATVEDEQPDRPLTEALHAFGEDLGDIGDDFSVALMKIVPCTEVAPPPAGPGDVPGDAP